MSGKLTDIATGKLLEKFGAGNHKPGSGSASALHGMLSAQMLRTVIDLIDETRRRNVYAAYIPELRIIKVEIDQRIYKALETLFQSDSEQFDRVINLRVQRDNEQNPQKRWELSVSAKEALKVATEIPLQIADLCIELGDFAAYVFDHAFKSARGDSGVALNGAISGIASCLSIIDLNLISLPVDDLTEKIRQHKENIKLNYNRLSSLGNARLKILETESNEAKIYQQSIAEFKAGNLADAVRSNSDLEKIVMRLQNTLWVNRHKIWKNEDLQNPLLLLKPDAVLKKVMDYTYRELDTLGTYQQAGEKFEIAGLIDKSKRMVHVYRNFPPETQYFTAAHELGHLILHRDVVLHRDKPIDGSAATPRNQQELQADKFAAYFLMP